MKSNRARLKARLMAKAEAENLELREEGYVIGSGMVESGVKRFKARFCGPGMR